MGEPACPSVPPRWHEGSEGRVVLSRVAGGSQGMGQDTRPGSDLAPKRAGQALQPEKGRVGETLWHQKDPMRLRDP